MSEPGEIHNQEDLARAFDCPEGTDPRDWIDEILNNYTELDCEVDWGLSDAESLAVRVGHRGVFEQYPFALEELWADIDDLEVELIQEAEPE